MCSVGGDEMTRLVRVTDRFLIPIRQRPVTREGRPGRKLSSLSSLYTCFRFTSVWMKWSTKGCSVSCCLLGERQALTKMAQRTRSGDFIQFYVRGLPARDVWVRTQGTARNFLVGTQGTTVTSGWEPREQRGTSGWEPGNNGELLGGNNGELLVGNQGTTGNFWVGTREQRGTSGWEPGNNGELLGGNQGTTRNFWVGTREQRGTSGWEPGNNEELLGGNPGKINTYKPQTRSGTHTELHHGRKREKEGGGVDVTLS